RLFGQHAGGVLGPARDDRRIDVERLSDHLGWRMREPVRQRYALILRRPEHGEELEVAVAGIEDVVAEVALDVTDVAGIEVEGRDMRARVEDAQAALALDPVLPFIGVGMPMQLAQAARMDEDEAGRDGLGDVEVGAVGDALLAARGLAN